MTGPSAIRRRSVQWALLALVVGAAVIVNHVRDFGGVSSLIVVGVDSEVRPVVEPDFDSLALVGGIGHDGQFAYLVAVDPDGSEVTESIDHPGYRYRRILMPLIGGLGGSLRGDAAVIGLATVNLTAFVASALLLSRLAASFHAPQWVVLGVVANPGLWQALRISTPDVPALALSLGAVLAWRHRRFALVALLLALAGLTKDQYLLVALSIAGYEWFHGARLRGASLAAAGVVPVGLWTVVLAIRMGDIAGPSNFSAPFVGIVQAVEYWGSSATWELALLALTMLAMVVAVVGVVRTGDTQLRWLTWPWLALATVSSYPIWAFGNNVARVFAPIAVFGLLAYGSSRPGHEGSQQVSYSEASP